MKKLTLDLNALEVDSFHTSWLDNWEGTVNGAQDKIKTARMLCIVGYVLFGLNVLAGIAYTILGVVMAAS